MNDSPGPATTPTRLREKASTDRAQLDELLDSVQVGHVALVVDGHPVTLPTLVVRDGDRVLTHGSTGSPWLRALAGGADSCLAVTALDGLVVARSAFESSMHYRSAMLFGRWTRLTGGEATDALDVVTEALLPGRTAEVRRPTDRELAATVVLTLPIERWSLKVSADWPDDPDDDVAGDAWAGVVPRTAGWGSPRPAPDLRDGIAVPPSVRGLS
ncbi:pyridoxamine 5'-phosphate oxidase family protein [uncultured Jatrophihabitans sp.]|uniref:pyridoxamine 5'-phosphate oxidase family protein n=1 Tax=uncultured Jatrophihabitans sp. TaxID=1610747 RepID=UPI0035C9D065